MDVQRITKSAHNYDEIVNWQKKLSDISDESDFYDISAGLVQIYGILAKQGAFSRSTKQDKKIAEWLSEQLSEFWVHLLSSVGKFPAIASSAALKVVLIRGKYQKLPIGDYMSQLISEAIVNPISLETLHPFFVRHDDLRYSLMLYLPQLSQKDHVHNLLNTLCEFEKTITVDSDLNSIYASRFDLPFESKTAALKYRQAWQQGWLHILRQPLNNEEIKQVLTVLHARIIPNFNKPHLLMDSLVDAYEHGGAVSLLALNALFVLIQYYQLDYPQFFTKLYELLEDGTLLFSAHRARFLRLLDLFLTSTHLPATIPASIIKRLARLCVFAPPGAIVAILPFVYNQLKRHPTCMIMIHRHEAALSPESQDPFDNNESDPLLTRALDSSLWELQSLTTHYHPNVAAIARIFSQPFKKPHYQLEHFLSHSYETLYFTEHQRKRDREPGLEFEEYNVFDDLGPTWSVC